MVKHLRVLLLLLMTIVTGGGIYAQEVTLDFTSNTWGLPTSYFKEAATYTDGTYSVSFGNSNSGHKFSTNYLIFGKKGATLSLPAFDFDVEKIVVVGKSGASQSVKQNIYVGNTPVSTETKGAQDANIYKIADAYQAAGTIYTLKVTSAANTQVTKIEIYKTNTKNVTNITFGEDNDNRTFSVNVGDAFTAPTATLTPAEAGTLTYSSSNTDVATVDATTGAVTLGETAGTATITAAFEGNDTYAASSASYTIQLTKPFAVEDGVFDFSHPEAYGKGTSSSSSKDGDMAVGETLQAGNVTLTVSKNNTNTTTRFWNDGLRVYDDAQFTISVPKGYIIKAVEVNPSKDVTVGDLNSQNVTLDFNKTTLKTITVTYEQAAESKDVTLHVGSTGYATLYYSDRALTVPEYAEATTYSAEFGKGLEVSSRYEEGEIIPAGEAVVIYALEEGDYTFKEADGTNVTKDDTNMLFGSDEETAIDNDDTYYFYKLSLDSNGKNVGFYWGAENGASFTNGAHKAYLKVSKENAANAKAFIFGGDATGIQALTSDKTRANAPIYNLAGQRVSKTYKGIVIQNGKKYVK